MKRLFFIIMLICSAFVSVNAQNVSGNCYRGFVDAGYTNGIGDYDFGRFEINTSHGFQINPYIYLGGGAGLHFMSSYQSPNMEIALDKRDSQVEIPIFVNVRCDFSKGKFVPFIDIKGGTYLTNNGDLYDNISFGFRIATNQRQAVNLSFGYTTEKLEFQRFENFISYSSMAYTRKGEKLDANGISLKIGYEF